MNPTSVHRQAKQLIDAGRTADAVQLLERHLAHARDDHVARNMLAFAHFEAGDYRDAEDVYRVMVAMADPDPREQRSLAQTLIKQGRNDEAQAWLAAAAAADARHAKTGGAMAPPMQQGAPRGVPITELGLPSETELPEFTARMRARDQAAWWTEHWHGLPWFVRLFRLLIGVATLIIVAIVVYGFATFPS